MGESEVSSAAKWVGELVIGEIKYLGGVRNKVKRLSSELNGVANFLTDSTSGSRPRSETLKGIISEARDLAYDCEDAMETYALVVQHKLDDHDGFLGSILRYTCILPRALPAHRVGKQIDEIITRIAALQNKIKCYLPAAPNPVAGYRIQATQHSFWEPAEFGVVGFDEYSTQLRDSLNDVNDKRVILICGMGGIGKSTLADRTYQNPPPGLFAATGWAQATRQFDPKQVVETLLYSLTPEYDTQRMAKVEQAMRTNQAYGALREQMNFEKSLVIIDDIWDPEDWGSIVSALAVDNRKGSRIILTSRKSNLLPQDWDDTRKFILNVTPLDETSSWELFQKIVFPDSSRVDETEKKRLGEEMVKHCEGVPLAIVVLANTLKSKERVEDWHSTNASISSLAESGGFADGVYSQMYKVLRVSYDEMPSHLKLCFLQMANFPQGYEITAQKLYQVWVGEGLVVKNNDSESLEEDIAENNLKELVRRSMVQVASMNGTSIETCRLHDRMRDVCLQLARTENFVRKIDVDEARLLRNDQYFSERDERLRHLAVYMHQINESNSPPVRSKWAALLKKLGMLSPAKKAPNLRALLVFPVGQQSDDEINCHQLIESIVESYPLLRVFDCENVNGVTGVVPDKVKEMIHLRYLGLANTRVFKLPSSIQMLRWLQTLDLQVDNDPPQVLSLPNVLWKMKRLRHVYLPHYGGSSLTEIERLSSAPERYSIVGGEMLRLDGLENLQTVMNLDLDRVNPNGLPDLDNLRRISAVCKTINNIDAHALVHFVNNGRLEAFKLKLHACVLEQYPEILSPSEALDQLEIYAEETPKFHFTREFESYLLPQNLSSLSLYYLQLDKDPLPVLEKLPNLYYLGLVMCYDECKSLVCSAGGFPKLTMIYLDALINLENWTVGERALPNLSTLLIINCRKLNIPAAFDKITDRNIFNEDECSPVPEDRASASQG